MRQRHGSTRIRFRTVDPKNDQVLVLIGAQLGDIATGHAKIVRQYEGAFAEAPTAGRRVNVRALMNCGNADSLQKVQAWLEEKDNAELRPSLEALKKHLDNARRQHVRDRPAKAPKDLDLLWAKARQGPARGQPQGD